MNELFVIDSEAVSAQVIIIGENETAQGRAHKSETRNGRNRMLKNKTFKGHTEMGVRKK